MEDVEVKEKKEENKKKNKTINIKLPGITSFLIIFIFVSIIAVLVSKSTFKTQEKVIKLGFEDIGELVTQTCHTTVLEDSYNDREFFGLFKIPFTASRQIFSYDFDVEAALDFSNIEILSINDNDKVIEVKLPHSASRRPVLLTDTLMVYLDEESLFSRINLLQHNDAVEKMEAKATKACSDNKLIELADTNAERLISAFIKGNDKYRNYNIKFVYEGSMENEKD